VTRKIGDTWFSQPGIALSELSKYFGKEVTPAKMKEQIMALLDDWKEKQPPELAKPEKKSTLEK
jgi:ParB family chromosome partitioning protein